MRGILLLLLIACPKVFADGFSLKASRGNKNISYHATVEKDKIKVLPSGNTSKKVFFLKKKDFDFMMSEMAAVPSQGLKRCYRNQLELVFEKGNDKKIYRGCIFGKDVTSLKLKQIANSMSIGNLVK